MQTGELSLQDYLTVLRRRWPIIAVTCVLLSTVAYTWSATRATVYAARADVLVDFDLSAQISDPSSQSRYVTDRARRLENELRFARSREVADEAHQRLGQDTAATVAAATDADIISFTTMDGNAEQAALAANTFAEAYTDTRAARNAERFSEVITNMDTLLEQLRTQLAGLQGDSTPQAQSERDAIEEQIQIYSGRRTAYQLLSDASQDTSASIVAPAETPSSPVSPKPLRTAALSFTLALLLATGVAFLLEFIDDRLRSKDDLDAVAGGAISLALVPKAGGAPSVLHDESHGAVAEAFRTLATSVRFVGLRQQLRAIQITSANPGEGKTTVACHLAAALAAAGNDVILIDADLRAPRVHERFELGANDEGLSTVLLGERPLDAVIHGVPGRDRLWVLPSGPAPGNPAEFLWPANAPAGTQTLPELIEDLVEQGYTVIVDSPPVLPVADALTLSHGVDGTIVVAAAGRTRARALQRAFELLQQADARIVGTVLNRATDRTAKYGYGYGDRHTAATPSAQGVAPPPQPDAELVSASAQAGVESMFTVDVTDAEPAVELAAPTTPAKRAKPPVKHARDGRGPAAEELVRRLHTHLGSADAH